MSTEDLASHNAGVIAGLKRSGMGPVLRKQEPQQAEPVPLEE